jgi:hypothetical protein
MSAINWIMPAIYGAIAFSQIVAFISCPEDERNYLGILLIFTAVSACVYAVQIADKGGFCP